MGSSGLSARARRLSDARRVVSIRLQTPRSGHLWRAVQLLATACRLRPASVAQRHRAVHQWRKRKFKWQTGPTTFTHLKINFIS